MKKQNLVIGLAAGAGVAALVYGLFSSDIPKGATAVSPFEKERYMGLWYEIARMPNLIEKDLIKLTEEYAMDDNGNMTVVTRSYNQKKDKWNEVSGKLKMAGPDSVGMLKVSYFGPAYVAYNVLALDPDYRYALVSGSGSGYLWILSKGKSIPEDIKQQFLAQAQQIGFDINKLEWPAA
ncbi:lipocalin family protein [Mucilaginibacter antarcticus]|uniref:Lipocalin family protein n=1 Tax=Mucilaginibacter antarcticus TaxID=1855725 RepID=A0ABW5XRM1_9SPHI